jgi:hypothetical protein
VPRDLLPLKMIVSSKGILQTYCGIREKQREMNEKE